MIATLTGDIELDRIRFKPFRHVVMGQSDTRICGKAGHRLFGDRPRPEILTYPVWHLPFPNRLMSAGALNSLRLFRLINERQRMAQKAARQDECRAAQTGKGLVDESQPKKTPCRQVVTES